MPFRKKLNNTDHEYMKNYKYLKKIDNRVKVFEHKQIIPSALQNIGFYSKRILEKIGVKNKPVKNFLHQKIIILPSFNQKIDCIISRHFFPKLPFHNKPIVVHSTYHPNNFRKPRKERRRVVKRIESKFLDVNKVILSTNVEKDHLLNDSRRLTDGRIFQVPYFLPKVEPIQPDSIEKKFSDYRPVRVLFVGSDGTRKGVHNLVKALNRICDQYPDVRNNLKATIITGDELPTCDIEVDKHEYLNRDEVLEAFRQSHIFCMPTLKDSYGLVYIEAMASGCAVVADDSPVRREILDDGDAGLLSDPQDPDDIAEKLLTLIQSPEYACTIAKRARQRFRDHYHWRRVGQRYVNLLREASASKAQ